MSIELYTANRGCITQHQEDTKYLQWQDGMYVMLDDLECDYEKALVEDSLRRNRYYAFINDFCGDCVGILEGAVDYWHSPDYRLTIKLTRAQALYIATGETDVLRIND
jgi:hypothetical protein